MMSDIYSRITRHVLYTSLESYVSAFGSERTPLSQIVDENGGLDRLPEYPSPSTFWEHVRKVLVRGRGDKYAITELLLGGENATNPDFLETLKQALGPTAHQYCDEVGGLISPLFDTARGAALYARRRQETHFDFEERPECGERRQLERGGGQVKAELR